MIMSVFDKAERISIEALKHMGFRVMSENAGIVGHAMLVIRAVDSTYDSWEYIPALILDYYNHLGVKATRKYINGEYKTLNVKIIDIMDIESVIANEKTNMINELMAYWKDVDYHSREDLRKMITFK